MAQQDAKSGDVGSLAEGDAPLTMQDFKDSSSLDAASSAALLELSGHLLSILNDFCSDGDGIVSRSDVKLGDLLTLLLQALRLVSIKLMRRSSDDANVDGHFKRVLDGTLTALEWAGANGKLATASEAMRLLSSITTDSAGLETDTGLCEQIKSSSQHSVLQKQLSAQRDKSTAAPPQTACDEPSSSNHLGPLLARLIKPVSTVSSRSSGSLQKTDTISTGADRRRQVTRQQLQSADLLAGKRITGALCSMLKSCGLIHGALDFVSDGIKLALRLGLDLRQTRWNLLEMARFIAWNAAHPSGGAEMSPGVRSSCEKVLTTIIDMEGGSEQMHFRRNLEVLILCHMFIDSAPPLPLVSVSSELFAVALSLLTKMMNRVIADGFMQAADIDKEDLSVMIAACSKGPADAPLGANMAWDCTEPYSAMARLAAFLSVAGEQFLTTLLIALAESCVWAAPPSVSPSPARLSPPPTISSRSSPAPLSSMPKPGASKGLAAVPRTGKLEGEKLKAIEALEAIPHAPARSRELAGKTRDSAEPHVRAVDRLLKDSLFKLPASDLFGPLLAKQITGKVLDALLDLLRASSVGDGTGKIHARQLALSMVDKDYLSPERAAYVVGSALKRWPHRLPRDVLALVAKCAIKDAVASAEEGRDSEMVLVVLRAALEGFLSGAREGEQRSARASPAERSTDAVRPGECSSPASDGKAGSSSVGEETAGSSRLRRSGEGAGVLDLNHARVLGLLFNTLTAASRADCLSRAVEALVQVVDEPGLGLESVAGAVALMQYMLCNYSQPPDALLSGLEAFMRSDAGADAQEVEARGAWSSQCIVKMLRMEVGARDVDLSTSSVGLSLESETMLVLDITSPSQPLDEAAWDVLSAEGGQLAARLEAALVKLLNELLGGNAGGALFAREEAGCVLHAAWVTYGRLLTRRSAEAKLVVWPDDAAPSLEMLAGLRAWYMARQGAEPTAQDLKGLTACMDQVCRSSSGVADASMSLGFMLLGALVGLKQWLLGEIKLDQHADALLEDAELLLSSAQQIGGLLAAAWSACAALDSPGMDRLSEAALAAGLPLDSSVLPDVFRRNDPRVLHEASQAFISASRARPSDREQPAFRTWDAWVQTSLLEGLGGSEPGCDSVVRSATNLSRRLVDLVTWFALKLKRMREAADKQDTSAIDNTMERLSVLLADLATDSRFEFLRAQCEGCLKELSASEESHVQLLDLSHLRRIDSFLKVISGHDSMEAVASEPIQHCVRTVLDLVHDSRRSAALVVFYLDHSPGPVNRSVQTLPIDEAFPEGLHGKGDLALFLHVIAVSRDAQASRDVLKLFRATLERPASASLGRLKPFVRRRVAQVLAAKGSAQLKELLERLLLFKGLGPESTDPLQRVGSMASLSSKADGPGADGGLLPEATTVRRSTLRLLTLVLDGVDEAVDALAGVLIEALLDLVPMVIRMPRAVLKECFALIKFVCFRQSPARVEQMIDVLVKSLRCDVEPASPEAAANLVDMLSGLVASFQSVSRPPFSDLCSVTSAHVRASDTLSTVSTSSEVSYTSRGESTVATSAVTYISSTGHMDPDDVSAVGSHMDCASMDMDAETASMDDDEELLRESQGLLDEQEAAAEEEERRLAGKVCTYTKTSDTFSEQHWYHCWTCGLTFQEGCCAVCAKVCHKGHDVTYSRFSRFFCDCGAGKRQGQGCDALAPRPPDQNGLSNGAVGRDVAANSNQGAAPPLPSEAGATGTRSPVLVDEDMGVSAWLADCERLPSQLTRVARETLLQRLRSKEVSTALSNLHDNMISVLAARDGAVGPKVVSMDDLVTVHQKDSKSIQLRRSVKAGSFAVSAGKPSSRQAAAAENDGFKLRSLGLLSMAANGLLIMAEGDHLVTLEARKKLMDASYQSTALDKSSVKTLFKTYLGFEATKVLSNPACGSHVAVCGSRKCSVFTISAAGKVLNVVALELSLEAFGQDVGLIDAFWMPNSEVCLCVVTDVFVNVYDLSVDNISPAFSLRLPGSERISGATLCWDAASVGLMVMSTDGALFVKSVGDAVNRGDGPTEMEVQVEMPEQVRGDCGHALHFSPKSQVLVCCFQPGSIVVAKLGKGFTAVEEVSKVDLGESRMVLDQVMDAGNAWGQMLLTGDTAGSCGLLHLTQGKAKIAWLTTGMGAPACRAVGMTATVSTRPALPGMLLLMEDGGLYHWVLCDHGMRFAEAAAPSNVEEDTKTPARPTFPVDVFEKGVCITQKIKIAGDFAPRPPLDLVRKFNSGNQPIISPHTDQLKVVIQNQNPEMCIIGLLVLVGEALNAHIPTELHLMDRAIETHAGVKRWYQLPLTTEEILNSDRELVLTTLGSHVASNPPAIDQIEVFGMRKDKFGWAEKQRRAAQLAAAKERSRKMRRVSSVRVVDPVEKAAMSIMNALAVHWSVGGLQSLESQCRIVRDQLLEELPKHLLLQRPVSLRPTLKRLLKVLFPTREVYCEAKDRTQLSAIADLLQLTGGQQLATVQLLSPGMLATATSLIARVSSRRPAHLSALLASRPDFLRQLAESFWLVFASCRYHCVDDLERAAESLVDTLHSFGTVHALKAQEEGSEESAATARGCMELLVDGLQSSSGRMRRVFEQRIGSLVVGEKEPVVTEVHFNDANQQQHDHMDAMRLGPLFWEECPVPEQGMERDGQSSIVYCCDNCGQQPVVGRRYHCRVCKDFDLCSDCYRSIQEEAAVLDPESDPTDEWLYPAGVDPSNEEALMKLAIELSLEKDTPRPPTAEFALALLPVLCERLPVMLREGGVACLPSLQLLLRFAKTALRDDGAALGTLAESMSQLLLDIGPVQPGSGGAVGRRVQPLCLSLVLLAQLIAGADRMGGASGASAGRSDKSWKRWEGRGVSGMHPEVLRVLKEDAFLEYLRKVLEGCLAVLEQNSAAGPGAARAGEAGRLLGRGMSLGGEEDDALFGDGDGELCGPAQAMDTPEGQTHVLLDAVLQLCLRLQACQACLQRTAPEDADAGACKLLGDEWAALLCQCLHQAGAKEAHRVARRVLRGMYATRQEYHAVRDKAAILRHVEVLNRLAERGVLESNGEATHQDTVLVTWTLGKLLEIAAARPAHWQQLCRQSPSVMALLVQAALVMPEETVEAAVKLLSCSFEAVQPVSNAAPGDGSKVRKAKPAVVVANTRKHRATRGEAGPESESTDESDEEGKGQGVAKNMAMGGEPVDVVMQHPMMDTFLRKLALEVQSHAVRKEACKLVEGMWRHSAADRRTRLLHQLMRLVPQLPSYGQHSKHLLETLGNIASEVEGEEQELVLKELAAKVTVLIQDESMVVAHHPNACIYRALHRIVELEGYYLESKPCLICNNAEIPFGLHKLDSLKAEAKFTDSTQLVKLVCAQTIQRFTVTMTDVRLKPVKTINLYYNNKPVADVTELRGKWHLWKKTATLELSPEQLEASVDLTIPIVATNILIEFLAFHELPSAAAQRMVCPRCNRPVTDRHGICRHCRENAFQCRLCRNINYENLDAFLCNECGYCKHARFDYTLVCRPSFSVEPINSEEDKDKAVLTIERESENAHKCFEQIVACKKTLESLMGFAGLGSETEGVASEAAQSPPLPQQPPLPPPVPAGLLSRHIQTAAIVYCKDAKLAFQSMSNSVQMLAAVRQQLTIFLSRSAQPAPAPTPAVEGEKSVKRCYGCASRFVAHGLELVDRLVQKPACKRLILAEGLLQELIRSNIHSGPPACRRQARAVVCLLIRDDMALTEEMLAMVSHKIEVCLAHARSLQVEQVLENEMLLLMDACGMHDKCWELKHRALARELFRAVEAGGANQTAIAQGLILPCLNILAHVCCVPSSIKSQSAAQALQKVKLATEHRFRGPPSVTYAQWQAGAASYDAWKAKSGPATKEERLQRKYGKRWLSKWRGKRSGLALSETWIKHLLLNPCSQAVRAVTREVMGALASSSTYRALTVLDLVAGMMGEAAAAQDQSAELFMLVHKLLAEEGGREFLAARGFLSKLCGLISAEVMRIRAHESSSTGDIAQGYVLKQLLEMLDALLRVPSIRNRFKHTEGLLGSMLDNFLHVQSLIVQKTKLTDDCAQLLMATFSSLSSESEEDKKRFCLSCVRALHEHRQGRTPVFLLQQLVGIMCPSKAEPSYDLVLNKSPTQEEFIRGAMTKNPYASAEVGPTMRDVKRKICFDLEMQGLMDDENAMELLVNGHIVRLDLPVRLVYEQVWRPSLPERVLARGANGSGTQLPPMVVIYRLQGLDGEATEPIVEELRDEEEEVDPEEELAMTALMSESEGMAVLLERVEEMDSLPARAELEPLILGLLYDCCRLKVNRLKALSLGAVDILLARIQRALEGDELPPSAETMLLVVDQLVEEASKQEQPEDDSPDAAPEGARRVDSGEAGANLERLLGKLGAPAVRSKPKIMQTFAHILPFLTYGYAELLNRLVDHFMPYLVFATADEQGGVQSDAGVAEERMAYLDCLVSVVQRMGQDETAQKLRAAFMDRGVVGKLAVALAKTLPLGKDKEDPAWTEAVSVGCLPQLLQMLAGMARGFGPAQGEVAKAGVLSAVHVLEEMASERQTGSLAEDLLAALSVDNPELREEVEGLRQRTVEKKREIAKAQREKMLAEMGLGQGGGAFAMHAKALGMDEMDLEEEEEGQVCVICHEGYKYKPEEVMGIYVLNKRCSVIGGVGGGSAAASPARSGPAGRWERCFVTVSNMTVVHYSCHAQASRAERAMKVPRQEWEGASLRNQSTKCNNLLPMRSPRSPAHMFSEYAERYWATLSQLGRHEGSRFRMVVHDVRLLLLRLAAGLSFATDSGGGSPLSNIKLLPYMLQMGYYCLGDPSTTAWRHANSGLSQSRARTSTGSSPDKAHGAALVDGPDFQCVATLWFPERWREERQTILHSMVAAAMRAVPAAEVAAGNLATSELVLGACRSTVICFAFVKRLHALFHSGKLDREAAARAEGGEESRKSAEAAAWSSQAEAAQAKIVADEMKVIAACEELVALYEEELAPCESLSELLDAAELLHDITPPCDTEGFLDSAGGVHAGAAAVSTSAA